MKQTTGTKDEAQAGQTCALKLTDSTPGSPEKGTLERFEEFFAPTPRGVGIPEHLVSESPLLKKTRRKLLKEYGRKPFRELFQLDALITRQPEAGVNHGSSGTTDRDGDCINCEKKRELRNTGPDTVRIQVPVGITRLEAARVLRKTAKWIESRHDVLNPSKWGWSGNVRVILDRCGE